jgi:hypothetical protein
VQTILFKRIIRQKTCISFSLRVTIETCSSQCQKILRKVKALGLLKAAKGASDQAEADSSTVTETVDL